MGDFRELYFIKTMPDVIWIISFTNRYFSFQTTNCSYNESTVKLKS